MRSFAIDEPGSPVRALYATLMRCDPQSSGDKRICIWWWHMFMYIWWSVCVCYEKWPLFRCHVSVFLTFILTSQREVKEKKKIPTFYCNKAQRSTQAIGLVTMLMKMLKMTKTLLLSSVNSWRGKWCPTNGLRDQYQAGGDEHSPSFLAVQDSSISDNVGRSVWAN